MTERAGARKPAFFVSEQMDLLTAVLDRIVPSEAGLPGAGELRVATYVDRIVAQSAHLRKLFAAGLAELSVRAGLGGFTALTDDRKDAVLREVESAWQEKKEAGAGANLIRSEASDKVKEAAGKLERAAQDGAQMTIPGTD